MTLLVDGAVKAAVLLIFAVGAAIFMRRRSAAARHWVLTLGVGCAVLVPSLALVVPSWSISLPAADRTRTAVPSSPVATTVIKIEPVGTSPAPAPAAPPPKVAPRSAAPLLVALWLAGFAALASRLLAGLVRLKLVANGARRVTNGAWLRCADEIARASGLKRPVVLLQSEHPALLVTWGWRSPKVLLPAAARLWTGDRMAIVLRHEIAHIRRGDWAAQLAGELLRSLHWFNPLVWVACRRLRRESEQACDDAVVQSGVDPTDYASHLVDLARTLNAGRRAGVPAMAMARPSSLEGRISAMLNSRLDRRPLSRAAQAATAAAFIAATLSIAGAAQARYSTFSGAVVDETNAFLPNTTLVLTNNGSKARHEVRSDGTGRFEFVGLPPGDYTLQVGQAGFATLNESLSISRDVARTIELQVASLEETIRIVGGSSPAAPDPDRAAKQQAVRQKAQERQQRANQRCEGAAAGGLGGNILQPWKIADVRPVYPATASSTRTGGVVTMEAIIGTDGTVREVRVISSPHPDLDRAAADAVRQWEFTPTILNCTPIEVKMKVTATFVAP